MLWDCLATLLWLRFCVEVLPSCPLVQGPIDGDAWRRGWLCGQEGVGDHKQGSDGTETDTYLILGLWVS